MSPSPPPFDFQFDQDKVDELCRDQYWCGSELRSGNVAFGLADIFKEYANLPQQYSLRLSMETGLKFDDNQSAIANKTIFQTILTPSKIRTPIIEREAGKRALPVGIGFLYAKALFQKFDLKIISESDRKGTIVFPFKSTPKTTVHFDHAAYAVELKSLPEQFQPVYACLYWADVTKGLSKVYREADIPIVTAGHRNDPLFFHRFYDLCRRFRYSSSNDIGTNLFLSVHSGCRFFYLDGDGLRREVISDSKIDDRIGTTFDKNREISRKLFAEPVEKITPEQRAFVDSFLGLKHFVSPKKLRRILLREQRLFEKRPWWHGEKKLLAHPDASDFTWNKFAPSQGWYFLENEGDISFRWMGQTDDAWVELSYPRRFQKREAYLNVQIHCIACDHLEISVNNVKIPDIKLIQDGNQFRVSGLLSPEILTKSPSKGVVRIGFHVKNAFPPNEPDANYAETRRLGVAVSHISLRPTPRNN